MVQRGSLSELCLACLVFNCTSIKVWQLEDNYAEDGLKCISNVYLSSMNDWL
jgi:hypothetical protein